MKKIAKEEQQQLPEWIKGNLSSDDFSCVYNDTASNVMPSLKKENFDEFWRLGDRRGDNVLKILVFRGVLLTIILLVSVSQCPD